MIRIWRLVTSLRTAAVILVVEAVLLLLNVAVPQRAILGDEAYRQLVERGPVPHFFLETMGLGEVATSVPFVLTLAAVFVVLSCVVIDRFGTTIRRLQLRPPSADALRSRVERESLAIGPQRDHWGRVTRNVLKGFGYRTVRVGATAVWGVKHRHAILGFPFFHAAFLLLLAGGVQIYLTRFVGAARVVEGQSFSTAEAEVVRAPSWAGAPQIELTVREVDARDIDGEAVHLSAVLAGEGGPQESRVNHPARYGSTSVLVHSAGLAPVIWLQDRQGFTLDRVAVATNTRGSEASVVPLMGGEFELGTEPLGADAPLPARDELHDIDLSFTLRDAKGTVYRARLHSGERAAMGDVVLVLEDLRYWVGLRVVSERGGGLLIAGFTVAVAALCWRLVWVRREVAVSSAPDGLRLWGRGELYPWRFREELNAIASELGSELARSADESSEPGDMEVMS